MLKFDELLKADPRSRPEEIYNFSLVLLSWL